jgi:uncharacterized protein (AIM24 family)
MANIINAITSGAGGLSTSADSSGTLNIQSAGTTIAAIASTGMAVTGTLSASGAATLSSTLGVTGDLSFNSGYGSAAVAYGCRAWVNFNGTGTVAIRASGNVTSITDNGTGDYTVNFTTAMTDANYSTTGTSGGVNTGYVLGVYSSAASPSTTAVRVGNFRAGTGLADEAYINVTVHR